MAYWRNKTIVITGGSTGLGLRMAQQAARRQANVVLVARDVPRLEAAVASLTPGTAGRVLSLAADLTRQADVERAFAQLNAEFPRGFDALVNCAGMSSRRAVLDTTPEDFQSSWELNFLATVRCTRAAMPQLLAARGHLVNIGSLASKAASAFLGAYPATKFAVAAYSQQLRLELANQGLHVLLVCPGPIARDDAGYRYEALSVPEQARKPGGGVRLRGIDPDWLAERILAACERRTLELVVPGRARWLFAVSQISPGWGDWLIRRMTSA